MRSWRNADAAGLNPADFGRPGSIPGGRTSYLDVAKWQTRKVEGLVGNREGSTPSVQTSVGDVAERRLRRAVDALSFGASVVRVHPSPPVCVRMPL